MPKRKTIVGSVIAVAVLGLAVLLGVRHASRARYFAKASGRSVGLVRSFVRDLAAGQFKVAASKAMDNFNNPRDIEVRAQPSFPSPLASEEYVLVYKIANNGYTLWRVDGRITLASGKALYGQFDAVDQPDGRQKIADWTIEDWPHSAFKLGDAIPPPGRDVEWSPWARDVTHMTPK